MLTAREHDSLQIDMKNANFEVVEQKLLILQVKGSNLSIY